MSVTAGETASPEQRENFMIISSKWFTHSGTGPVHLGLELVTVRLDGDREQSACLQIRNVFDTTDEWPNNRPNYLADPIVDSGFVLDRATLVALHQAIGAWLASADSSTTPPPPPPPPDKARFLEFFPVAPPGPGEAPGLSLFVSASDNRLYFRDSRGDDHPVSPPAPVQDQ